MRRAAPSADPGSRRAPAVATELVAAGGAAALVVAFCLSPDHVEDGPVICPFRRLTGLPCPGCGLTRAWVYAAHGWWRESWLAHPFGLVAVVAVVALLVAVVAARVRRRTAPDLDRLVAHPLLRVVIAAWLVFSVVRLGLAL